MTTKLLQEASSAAPTKVGNRWRGILAVPGQGSSGFYSEHVLREYGPKAIAPGAKAFINHDPERNPRDMIGIYPDGAHYEEGVGLVGDLEVFPHWKEFVETVGPHAALSIYMMGESDDEGNITALLPDRQNGIDLVSYAGLEGSGLVAKLYESAHKTSATAEPGSAPAASRTEKKENLLDPKDFEERMARIEESLAALLPAVTALVESLKPAEKPDVDVAAAAVEADRKATEAGIPVELRTAIVEAAKSGGDVDAALAESKRVVESVKASVIAEAEADGRFGGAGDAEYKLSGFGGGK